MKTVTLFGQNLARRRAAGTVLHGETDQLREAVGRQGDLKQQRQVDKTGRQIWRQIEKSFEIGRAHV